MWFAPYWREVQVKALLQSEAHRDIRPYVRKRGRPRQIPDAAGVPSGVCTWCDRRLQARPSDRRHGVRCGDRPDAGPFSYAGDARDHHAAGPRATARQVNAGDLAGAVDLNDARTTSIKQRSGPGNRGWD